MAGINMKSILAKAQACTASAELQKKIEAKIDQVMLTGGGAPGGAAISTAGASAAAGKFIEVLQNEVKSLGGGGSYSGGGLGDTAVSAATSLEHGAPQKVGKNKYQIDVWFSGDLHRDSLAPDKYDGVDNIVALLNNGRKRTDGSAYGLWHGHEIVGLRYRSGANFISSAVHNFMANYGTEYGVTDIDVSPIYK